MTGWSWSVMGARSAYNRGNARMDNSGISHRWQAKCLIDTAKACLPFKRQLRLLKDRVLGYRREPEKDANTIRDGLLLIEWLGDLSTSNILEIGTGWQPMIPILFSIAGASRVYTADSHRLMRRDTFSAALVALRENRNEIIRRLPVTPAAFDHATRDSGDIERRLEELRVTYLAPCDCRRLLFGPGSIYIITSRAVLEHIPPTVVADIFVEANRVLRAGGLMLHLIDNSDHWSHRDPHISAVNFLRYPDWLFRLTTFNPQDYQNRLRHSQYVAMLASSGFILKREHRTVNPDCLTVLSKMRLAERFRPFDPEDLSTTTSILLAERCHPMKSMAFPGL